MKNCLLLLAVVAALLVGAPAYSQYVFLDVDHDTFNSVNGGNPGPGNDVLVAGVNNVDVYFVTNKNRDGSDAVCASGSETFSIVSYEVSIHSTGSGSVVIGTWTDAMGFANGLTSCGTMCSNNVDAWIARGGAIADLKPAGKYKVGTLQVTVTGAVKLDVAAGVPNLDTHAATTFGSECAGGIAFDNTIRLDQDFFDKDGTAAPIAVVKTTWGEIKKLYQ